MFGFGFSMVTHLGIVLLWFIFELLFRGKLLRYIRTFSQSLMGLGGIIRKGLGNLFLSRRHQ